MVTLRYEMEDMSHVRHLVTGDKHGLSHEDVDAFKRVLSALEHEGFELVREEPNYGT